jgi:hypothetical protein
LRLPVNFIDCERDNAAFERVALGDSSGMLVKTFLIAASTDRTSDRRCVRLPERIALRPDDSTSATLKRRLLGRVAAPSPADERVWCPW